MSSESILNESVVSTKMIYDGKVIRLRLDLNELPNHRTTLREVVEHPGAAAIVPLLEGNKIVLIKQYRHPTREVIVEIPAGTLKEGEKPEYCASRELTEETGYCAGAFKKLVSCYLAPGYSSEVIHIYLATDLSKVEQKPEADETIQVIAVNLEEAVQKITSGEIRDAKTIIGILHYLWFQTRR